METAPAQKVLGPPLRPAAIRGRRRVCEHAGGQGGSQGTSSSSGCVPVVVIARLI